ncbi:MAG: hypothetical protein H8D56_18245 [Planctomycetes bacterium]|nr:hypothetical protein [Planctomycetota bacterium]MBL7143794.1 hypothetical protein [Phycisphaerae bacterium]
MKKITGVLISIVVLALGLFLLFNDSADKNSSAIESDPSKAEVLPDKQVIKYDGALEPNVSDDSSITKDEFKQLSQEQQDEMMEEFIIDFWEKELGLLDKNLQEKRLSLDIFNRPYMKTITESEYFQLSPEDQEKAMAEVVDIAKKTRSFVKDVIAEAQSCITKKDYARAEACLLYAWEVGREFTNNKDGMYITRVVGISFEKDALNELVGVYTQLGDHSKVQTVKGRLSDLEKEMDEMRNAAK